MSMRSLTKLLSVVSIATALAAPPALATAGETLERIKGEELMRTALGALQRPFT